FAHHYVWATALTQYQRLEIHHQYSERSALRLVKVFSYEIAEPILPLRPEYQREPSGPRWSRCRETSFISDSVHDVVRRDTYLLQTLHGAGYMAVFNIQHTGVSRFQYTTFKNHTELQIPDLPVQRQIAAILSAYDELIENNKRRIALLEKMAEEIYREWFVRLRFPGHEKVKKVKGVPEGWIIDRVDSIGKVVTGKTPPTSISRYYGEPYLFIKTPDMHGNMFVFESEERLSQAGLDSQPSQTIPEGSICVSCIGTGGIVSITTSKCQTNQQINSVVLRDKSDLEWAFFTLRNLRETIRM